MGWTDKRKYDQNSQALQYSFTKQFPFEKADDALKKSWDTFLDDTAADTALERTALPSSPSLSVDLNLLAAVVLVRGPRCRSVGGPGDQSMLGEAIAPLRGRNNTDVELQLQRDRSAVRRPLHVFARRGAHGQPVTVARPHAPDADISRPGNHDPVVEAPPVH
ncbi:unnamed protein product [Phytophthora lilii]|uniref:Unnamed protein product n=1 Tax=Phytophthora lilii TaxID=2077276 RepID=A0A9W6TCD0_9STRA|nr:unnamed protein product [Phytophthora lilii]